MQGWQVVIEFEDHETGSKSDRAAFRQMIYDAGIGKWDRLVFWSLDRFTREGALANPVVSTKTGELRHSVAKSHRGVDRRCPRAIP